MVRPRGGVSHLEWTGRFDGSDYPVQGVEEVVTYAYQRIDGRTYDVITKVDGRPAATSRAVLSADGRSITTTTAGRDSRGVDVTTITVYEARFLTTDNREPTTALQPANGSGGRIQRNGL